VIDVKKSYNKNIKVKCLDGTEVEGFCSVYNNALDNELEIASIIIETSNGSFIEVYENEIKTIEIAG
jgi:hypothetical protein